MMPSSTSRFLASMAFFRDASCVDCVSSVARAVRLVSMIFSSPSMRARRALMLSDTAPSAFARLFTRALRRAAWTGGVGVGLLGSVSLSYSLSAVGTALAVVAVALETAIWRETRGWSSVGAEGPVELEKREPPSRGFFLPALSISDFCKPDFRRLNGGRQTVDAGFDCFLNRILEDLPLSPDFNDTAQF